MDSVQQPWRRHAFAITGLVVTSSVAWTAWPSASCPEPLEATNSLERSLLDAEFAIRGPRPADPRIVIVGFDSATERALGPWPASRALFHDAIKNLVSEGARLIVLDVLFEGKTTPSHDASLQRLLSEQQNVVLAARFDRDPSDRASRKSLIVPSVNGIDDLPGSIGLVEVSPDDDAVIRRFIPNGSLFGEPIYSLPLQALSLLEKRPVVASPGKIGVGSIQIPLSSPAIIDPVDKSIAMSTYPDFAGGAGSFPIVCDLANLASGNFPKGVFKNKIVFLGITGQQITKELGDSYVLGSTAKRVELIGGAYSRRVPGVIAQAQFLNCALQGRWLVPLPPLLVTLCAAILSTAMMAIGRRFMNWRGLLSIVCLGALMLTFSYVAMATLGYILPIASATVSASLFAISGAWMDRSRLRERWSRYVSPRVFELILASNEDMSALRCRATIMFIDIRGFTAYAHKAPPAEVLLALNQHFEKIMPILEEEDATIDKFMGDGVLCVFGAPREQADAPIRAARAARALRTVDSGFPFGIGIATGVVVVGHVGTTRRHDFSVIGDIANLASRIQGVSGPNQTVLDQATAIAISGHFESRSLGEFELKGMDQPMHLFELL
ncbi:MAG: adenylate/guanylate cyclase domain-containing protein [Fimbriimonadaceae bacterium]